ncbi:hypothetical protein ACH5RR_007408 [Cinchona calisaya]|uniref:Uncharacterized protein n=1 Tax=Cinchona calisaya TaxID=153742 RepID=A0ABD3ARP0_9GENT
MNFIKGDRSFMSINHVENSFVFLAKAIKNLIKEIFFINGFSKNGKFISPILDKLHLLGSCLGTLDTILQLVLDLFNVTTGWFDIGRIWSQLTINSDGWYGIGMRIAKKVIKTISF